MDHVSSLTVAEFERHYLREGRPVVIEDAIQNWGALSWTLSSLASQIGGCVAPVGRTCKATRHTEFQETRLETYFENIRGEGRGDELERLCLSDYRILVGGDPINEVGELLAGDLGELPYAPASQRGYASLYVGVDSETPCHYHHKSEAFLAELVGPKTVVLIGPENTRSLDRAGGLPFNFSWSQFSRPDDSSYKTCEEVSGTRVELQAGQVLYIPLHWWHYVYADSFHASLAVWFDSSWRNWKRSPVLLPSLAEILAANSRLNLGLRKKLETLLKGGHKRWTPSVEDRTNKPGSGSVPE